MAAITSTTQTTTLILFDVDGTLTKARQVIEDDMWTVLTALKSTGKYTLGVVGGSDFVKQKEQLGGQCDAIFNLFDFNFAENGLIGYEKGTLIQSNSIGNEIGDTDLTLFLNFVLAYLAKIELPIKRGTFVEYRTGMINISPIGRNCSTDERNAFEVYDHEFKVRETMVNVLKNEFKHLNLQFSIGGQISFDVFPAGWDKTYCLKFLKPEAYDEIHFFGDKTYKGGNDYELFNDDRVIGHTVTSPQDTLKILREYL